MSGLVRSNAEDRLRRMTPLPLHRPPFSCLPIPPGILLLSETSPKGSDQRVTLPALMQEAQTFNRLGVPDTTA
jgi:hypothetical protein